MNDVKSREFDFNLKIFIIFIQNNFSVCMPVCCWQSPMRSLRLPDEVCGLETLADFIMDQPQGLQSHVRGCDAYGAVVSIAVALYQPNGLVDHYTETRRMRVKACYRSEC